MSLFSSKNAEYEYASIHIEVAGLEIGDYSVGLGGSGYEDFEIVGNLYEIRSDSKSSVASGLVSVEFECNNLRPVTLGFVALDTGEDFFLTVKLVLTPDAQRDLANELRWRIPKFLTIDCRREKGTQGLFDVLSFRLSQDCTGRLQYENFKARAQGGGDG
jgi:hypothetical protein